MKKATIVHIEVDSIASFTEWMKAINDLPHPRILRKKLEQLTDSEVVDLIVSGELDHNEAYEHMTFKRSCVIQDMLVEIDREKYS